MYDYCLFVPIGNLCIFTLSVVNVFLTFSVGYPVFSWKVKQHWSVLTYWDKTQVSPSFHHTHYSLVTNYQINPFSHGVFDPGKKKIFKNLENPMIYGVFCLQGEEIEILIFFSNSNLNILSSSRGQNGGNWNFLVEYFFLKSLFEKSNTFQPLFKPISCCS